MYFKTLDLFSPYYFKPTSVGTGPFNFVYDQKPYPCQGSGPEEATDDS